MVPGRSKKFAKYVAAMVRFHAVPVVAKVITGLRLLDKQMPCGFNLFKPVFFYILKQSEF